MKTRNRSGRFSGDNSKSQQKGVMAGVTVRAKARTASGGKTDTRRQRRKPRPASASRWNLCPCASVNSTPGSPVTPFGARANYLSHRGLTAVRTQRYRARGRMRAKSPQGRPPRALLRLSVRERLCPSPRRGEGVTHAQS
uniref:Uncharacterized protein n=1 Tax=Rangifer tarandus platyrhynchus TaxID=3082113 RepID=A0ACB0EAX4_RANTA|nr:unnamed protein product [Rangifer tarandus platyrhynchus]